MTLDDFLVLVREEYAAAVAKHGGWEELTPWDMHDTLDNERLELFLAEEKHDLTGPHGILRESAQVAVVAARIAIEMTRRLQG